MSHKGLCGFKCVRGGVGVLCQNMGCKHFECLSNKLIEFELWEGINGYVTVVKLMGGSKVSLKLYCPYTNKIFILYIVEPVFSFESEPS